MLTASNPSVDPLTLSLAACHFGPLARHKKSLLFLELLFHAHSCLPNSAANREAESTSGTNFNSNSFFTQLYELLDWRC